MGPDFTLVLAGSKPRQIGSTPDLKGGEIGAAEGYAQPAVPTMA